jgi:hypothetical protein
MVENDIIEPTERSRLPLTTTKVTPSAMTPRMAEERITLMMLSGLRNCPLASVKPIMNKAKATRMPCRARKPPISFFVGVAIISSVRPDHPAP